MKKKNTSQESTQRQPYVRAVLEADQRENPMPSAAKETIFRRIISFFKIQRNNLRRD